MELIKKQIEESVRVKQLMLESTEIIKAIIDASDICISALQNGKKLLFAGNGGSAADSQHLAAELVNRFEFDRLPLAAIALTTDSSVLTSIANDYALERIFARQVEALGSTGDVLIALSTSGNSANVIEGLKAARGKGISIIGLTGSSGGKMNNLCDVIIKVPSDKTTRIQEAHILIGHIICSRIENCLFGAKSVVD